MGEELQQTNDQTLVSALRCSGADVPMPFDRDIFLLGIQIAGTNHVPDIERLYAELDEGKRVKLVREPNNPYDEYAVRIDTANDETLGYLFPEEVPVPKLEELPIECEKLGYIPRFENKVFARLMDAGKLLYGVVRSKEKINGYHRIVVKIYLKD